MARTSPLLMLLLAAGALASTDGPPQPTPIPAQPAYATDRVIVKYKDGTVRSAAAENDAGVVFSRNVGTFGAVLYKITDNTTVGEKVTQLSELSYVDRVEPDYLVYTQAITNDLRLAEMWHLPRVNTYEAWDIITGLPEVKVCHVDSGARMNHPDLAGNILKGWNFVPPGSNRALSAPAPGTPEYTNFDDLGGHGTHTAGTIAAVGNNMLGVAGVAYNVRLLVCKFIWEDGAGYVSDAMSCIRLCKAEGALVTSNSWGGIGYSQMLEQEIADAGRAGQLFVVAAGNQGQNLDQSPLYPASYKSENMISVAATGGDDVVSAYSNYGGNTVHVAAPGDGLLSTTYDGQYGQSWGTSMATPVVAGAAALLQSLALKYNTQLTHVQIKKLIMDTADRVPNTNGRVVSGRLNIGNAVKTLHAQLLAAQPSPPPPVESPPPTSPPPTLSPPPPAVRPITSVTPPACGTSPLKGKPCWQSSTFRGREARFANNGNCATNANLAESCSSTDIEGAQPWWYADLEADTTVVGISITTRSDCCWTSLGAAHVLVGSVPFAGPESLGDYQRCGQLPTSGISRGRRLTVSCGLPAGLQGRYVAVYLPKNSTSLTLCEVDVTTADMLQGARR